MPSRQLFVATTRFKEAIRFSRTLRSARGLLLWLESHAPMHPAARLDLLCQAYEVNESATLTPWLADRVQSHLEQAGAAALDWRQAPGAARFEAMRQKYPFIDRSVILKAPGPDGEKGLILSTFEYNWFRMAENPERFRELRSKFNLVLSTSWSPTGYLILALAAGQADDSLFVQSCNYDEIGKIERFHPKVRCLETLPCDWLHPDNYHPRAAAQRDIDIVMVSNWAPFKRHWELFNALRDMSPDLKIVCVGQPDSGKTLDDIRALQKHLGAPQQIEYLQSIPSPQVAELQSRAKVAIILSRWEGCCVAAAEGLMAGAALAMRFDAHVGPRAYINSDTGMQLRPAKLAAQLTQLLANTPAMHPRERALEKVSCLQSIQKLNAQIRAHELAKGRPWTHDLAMPMWRPHPTLALEADKQRLAPCYADLHAKWPDLFPADLMETSHT